MSKLSYNKKRSIAKQLFVEQGMTGRAVAEQIDVSTATVSRWRIDDKWDNERTEVLASPTKIRAILTKELISIAKGEDAKINADSLAKVSKVIQQFDRATSIPVIISVLKDFDNWMSEQEPDTAILFTKFHKQFIIHKIEQADEL